MKYQVKKDEIIIKIPACNSGKFRYKTRSNNLEFGDSFSTRENNFDERVYLEWQIGYDATVADISKGKKSTKITSLSFIGANHKEKHPYELSELVYGAVNNGLLKPNNLKSISDEIANYKDLIDEMNEISTGRISEVTINDVPFKETSIRLPTFFMVKTADNTQIEISIEKQQYATGVQPMVYFCIPIKSFRDYKGILGRPSKINESLTYVIDERNAHVLLEMVKIFAMCSKRHHHDIVEILKILIKLVK